MAKFYIYRNLHLKDTFSIRQRGRVVDRLASFEAHDVSFQVSELGRLRVLKHGQRNIHAFVVTDKYHMSTASSGNLKKVWYNPMKTATFMLGDEPITRAKRVLFKDGQCYLLETEDEEPSQDIRAKRKGS